MTEQDYRHLAWQLTKPELIGHAVRATCASASLPEMAPGSREPSDGAAGTRNECSEETG